MIRTAKVTTFSEFKNFLPSKHIPQTAEYLYRLPFHSFSLTAFPFDQHPPGTILPLPLTMGGPSLQHAAPISEGRVSSAQRPGSGTGPGTGTDGEGRGGVGHADPVKVKARPHRTGRPCSVRLPLGETADCTQRLFPETGDDTGDETGEGFLMVHVSVRGLALL